MIIARDCGGFIDRQKNHIVILGIHGRNPHIFGRQRRCGKRALREALRIKSAKIVDFDSPARHRGLDATSSSVGTAASGCLIGVGFN